MAVMPRYGIAPWDVIPIYARYPVIFPDYLAKSTVLSKEVIYSQPPKYRRSRGWRSNGGILQTVVFRVSVTYNNLEKTLFGNWKVGRSLTVSHWHDRGLASLHA